MKINITKSVISVVLIAVVMVGTNRGLKWFEATQRKPKSSPPEALIAKVEVKEDSMFIRRPGNMPLCKLEVAALPHMCRRPIPHRDRYGKVTKNTIFDRFAYVTFLHGPVLCSISVWDRRKSREVIIIIITTIKIRPTGLRF